LAAGVEESEAVIAIDVLRRAGWDVVTAGLQPGLVVASRGVKLQPDTVWESVDPNAFDVLVIPGGAGGVERLTSHSGVLQAIRVMQAGGKWIAAICAGPLVLQAAGILSGQAVTCHPGVATRLTAARRLDDAVVVDGRLVTSQGAGTTFEFALELVRRIGGEPCANDVAKGLVWRP
jgi:4-methyl-5(b-hydroxyethyl)-thiazole monophosphate biosynthesis